MLIHGCEEGTGPTRTWADTKFTSTFMVDLSDSTYRQSITAYRRPNDIWPRPHVIEIMIECIMVFGHIVFTISAFGCRG